MLTEIVASSWIEALGGLSRWVDAQRAALLLGKRRSGRAADPDRQCAHATPCRRPVISILPMCPRRIVQGAVQFPMLSTLAWGNPINEAVRAAMPWAHRAVRHARRTGGGRCRHGREQKPPNPSRRKAQGQAWPRSILRCARGAARAAGRRGPHARQLVSLDAANRAWMQGATYRSAVETGTVMAGARWPRLWTARAAGFKAGDLVFADTGWQDYAALPPRS